jgi:hypothetical protein
VGTGRRLCARPVRQPRPDRRSGVRPGRRRGYDEDGYRATVGLRGSFSPNFEGLAKVSFVDGDNVDGDFVGTLGAQYKFSQTWGIVGEAEFADGGEAYTLGLRASF